MYRPLVLLLGLLVAACAGPDADLQDGAVVTVFEGARLLTGDGQIIDDAVFVVAGDEFGAVGSADQVEIPRGATRVDLSGRTVIPALVNAHIHLSNDREEGRTAPPYGVLRCRDGGESGPR